MKNIFEKIHILDFKIFSFWFTEHLLLRCLRTKVSWCGFILLRSVYIFPWKAQLKKIQWCVQTEDFFDICSFWKINRKSKILGEKLHDLLILNVTALGEKFVWHLESAFWIYILNELQWFFRNKLRCMYVLRTTYKKYFLMSENLILKT